MEDRDGNGQQWSWSAPTSTTNDEDSEDVVHKKRLSMILRYIATMHHSNDASAGVSFVHDSCLENASDFLRNDDVLFATDDFRHILSIDQDGTLFKSPPFSFYKAAASPTSKKRTFAGTIKRSILSSEADINRTCWLRITRLAAETAPRTTPAIREYLRSWSEATHIHVLHLLTLDNIKNAPKVHTGFHSSEIKTFLRQYKKYLKRNAMRTALEPLYNRLFEWLQGGQGELVWGLGTASLTTSSHTIHGPLLECLVEVELSRDGALLVRPRPHTGVALNREVVNALDAGHEVLSSLHRTVSELETDQLSPGEPSTYTLLLKRMAHELSSGGSFVSVSNLAGRARGNFKSLVVTDAWCLYHRPKPSTVWARDASVLAERILLPQQSHKLPVASWSLTHGPASLASMQQTTHQNTAVASSGNAFWGMVKSAILRDNGMSLQSTTTWNRPLLALPTSESQNRIADLLLTQNYPAIVCEGPPGTGKTHTIANMVCAYLCQGKRVLVTSKGAPALSVLRERLPKCVQELCVDVSLSESAGMRQLQQTVERLADRVSCVDTGVQQEQCRLIQRTIRELEGELEDIDQQLLENAEQKRKLVQSPRGQELVDLSFQLIEAAPWLAETVASWTVADTNTLLDRVRVLCVSADDSTENVSGYDSPPSDGLISLVASKAGETFSLLKDAASKAVAFIPILGSVSGADVYREQLVNQLANIRINGDSPESREDWAQVLRALELDKQTHLLHEESLKRQIKRESWPTEELYDSSRERKRIQQSFVDLLETAVKVKELEWACNAANEIALSVEARKIDARRSKIAPKILHLAEELVEATVISQLSKMFSPEAQSALIRFAQIAGKAKFSKSSQASKMSQRQRRHRKEYLEAFEKCVRYIPCWILTTSQISDYLPAEFGLFDLVVIDEASQSDVTALPGMLRGKQWLIVGDGKQVSPSESFLSETQIESLRSVLPESPLEESLLPGRSFFDLCAQAFPRGRVVLREHFRCAPEIIEFSNAHFYDGRLVPLRLPTKAERLTPSLIDVRVKGAKVGKINEVECDKIVEMIRDYVVESDADTFPRSIGVISLVGDEQSRLIRGRLLDVIGPQKYKEHDILIGDAPTFQGGERDIVFLSMVCSPGRVPTQSQLMYAQRANVALSRARDRMVLVRSIDSSHVPSLDDVKIPILEFFADAASEDSDEEAEEKRPARPKEGGGLFSFRTQAQSLLEDLLRGKGYSIRNMGVVWNDSICVEDREAGRRAAVCFECAGESTEEWSRLVKQQKSIERVGWKTFRVDGLSFLADSRATLKSVENFLRDAGVGPLKVHDVDDEEVEVLDELPEEEEADDEVEVAADAVNAEDAIVISSDEGEDDESMNGDSAKGSRRHAAEVEVKSEVDEDAVDPSQFGDVANLGFLRGSEDSEDIMSAIDDPYHPVGSGRLRDDVLNMESNDDEDGDENGHRKIAARAKGVARASNNENMQDVVNLNSDNENDADNAGNGLARVPRKEEEEEDFSDGSGPPRKRRRRTTRLNKYSRDGRYYPGRKTGDEYDDDKRNWYDTDSDLPSKPLAKDTSPWLPDAASSDSDDEDPLN